MPTALVAAIVLLTVAGCGETPEEKAARSFEEWKSAHCASPLGKNDSDCQRRALAKDIVRELRKAD